MSSEHEPTLATSTEKVYWICSNFAQFQASGCDAPDLRVYEEFGFGDTEMFPHPIPGRLYVGDIYIFAPDAGCAEWVFECGNFCRKGTLEQVEVEAYGFYISESRSCSKHMTFLLADEAPNSMYRGDREPDTRQYLDTLYSHFGAQYGYSLGDAADMVTRGHDKSGVPFPPDHLDWLVRFVNRRNAIANTDDE